MRLYDWESRLTAYAVRVAHEGFAWGRHDCALFAAGAVEAVTGTDPAAEWRGRYTTLAGGLRLMRKAGFEDHIAAARTWFPEMPASGAMAGDLAVVGTDDGPALGVVQGSLIYVLHRDCNVLGLVTRDRASEFLGVR